MNRFFLKEKASATNKITDKGDISHLKNALRLKTKDKIEVVDSCGKEYIMEIGHISPDMVVLKTEKKTDIKREPAIDITVYQGIPKGQRMDYLVQKLTEVGVKRIVPVKMKRCVKEQISPQKMIRYNSIIKEAAMQSKRLIIPKLEEPMDFAQMLTDFNKNQENLVFYEEEQENTIKSYVKNNQSLSSLGIVIGPEGGIDEGEIQSLKQAGLDTLTLGQRILRTETAGLVASAIFIYEYE